MFYSLHNIFLKILSIFGEFTMTDINKDIHDLLNKYHKSRISSEVLIRDNSSEAKIFMQQYIMDTAELQIIALGATIENPRVIFWKTWFTTFKMERAIVELDKRFKRKIERQARNKNKMAQGISVQDVWLGEVV